MRILLYIVALTLGLQYWSFGIDDPDLGWHLLGGAWILEHGQVPRADFINSFNTKWSDYHWLGQIIFYKVYSLGGFPALRLFHGLLLAFFFKVLTDIILIAGGPRPSHLLSLTVGLLSHFLISTIISVRPQILALCIIALTLRRLLKHENKFELFYLLALTIFLVNVHVYWIFIPFLYGCYRLAPRILAKEEFRTSLVVFFVLCLMGFVSPYTYQNYLVLWDYLNMPPYLRDVISEFKSSFTKRGALPWILLGYLVIVVRAFKLNLFLSRPGDFLSAISAFMLAVRSIKFIGLFGIVGLPLITGFVTPRFKKFVEVGGRRERLFFHCAVYPIILAATFSLIYGFPFWPRNREEKFLHNSYPIEACKRLSNLNITTSKRNHGRVATHFNHGGWCKFAIDMFQEKPAPWRVTTDGRTQDAPLTQFKDSFDLYNMRENWSQVLATWHPAAIVVHKDHALANSMGFLQNWKLEYKDDNFKLFIVTN